MMVQECVFQNYRINLTAYSDVFSRQIKNNKVVAQFRRNVLSVLGFQMLDA